MEHETSPSVSLGNIKEHTERAGRTHATRWASYLTVLRNASTDHTYATPESFLALPSDIALERRVGEVINRIRTPKLRYIFLVGIGGSSVGAEAVVCAITGASDAKRGTKYPKLITLDNPSSANFGSVSDIIQEELESAEEFAVVIESKSGTTIETIANAAALLSVASRFEGYASRIVVVSDAGSPLARVAGSEGWSTLDIPKKVGGRYSIFSPAGLVVIGLMGIDISEFLRGAETGITEGLVASKKNVAILLAASTLAMIQKKVSVIDAMYFSPQLFGVGLWYRQLFAESLGKKFSGKFRGATCPFPTVSIGTSDMHSIAQLVFGASRGIFTRLVSVDATHRDVAISPHKILEAAPAVAGLSLHGLQRVMRSGIARAYASAKLPYIQLSIPSLSARTLGHLMAIHMIEILLVARAVGVDAFTQPHVELYKKHVRAKMKKKSA
ncbi:MAG: hypothetical protein AAB343_01950 [Patescibacteria group bacterium]